MSYECSICGKEFEHSQDRRDHERNCGIKNLGEFDHEWIMIDELQEKIRESDIEVQLSGDSKRCRMDCMTADTDESKCRCRCDGEHHGLFTQQTLTEVLA